MSVTTICSDIDWRRLPKTLRDKVWATFRPGQETNLSPSREYLAVAEEVQEWIATHYPDRP